MLKFDQFSQNEVKIVSRQNGPHMGWSLVAESAGPAGELFQNKFKAHRISRIRTACGLRLDHFDRIANLVVVAAVVFFVLGLFYIELFFLLLLSCFMINLF